MKRVGEWLNGRVAVSKTVGCVFESRLPCHRRGLSERIVRFFCVKGVAGIVIRTKKAEQPVGVPPC